MDALSALAVRYGTDKGPLPATGAGRGHGYTVHYDAMLGGMREQVQSVLEIGVLGGASLRMWRDYFPNAVIHGLDYAREISATALDQLNTDEPRLCVHVGDQASGADLEKVVQCADGRFNLIVDDGSHAPADYLASLLLLWGHVVPGGAYIIEDVRHEFLDATATAIAERLAISYVIVPSSYTYACALVLQKGRDV